MAGKVDDSFKHTATGVLGDKRNTMLRNELHLRNKLGETKSRGFILPETSYVYGSPTEKRRYTAAMALRGWAGTYPEKVPPGGVKHTTDRDFINLNQAALTGGLVNPPENFDFRATHDLRISPFKKAAGKLRSRRLPPNMVFGAPVRPSTPIYDLLEHKFQDKWLRERQKQLEAKRSAEAKATRKNNIVYETRASLLRTFQNPVDPQPLWHMPKFTESARPRIETFRVDGVKSNA